MKHLKFKQILILSLLLTIIVHVNAQYPSRQQWNILKGSTYSSQRFTGVYHADDQYANCMGTIYIILLLDHEDIYNYYYGLFREEDGKIFYRQLNPDQSAGPEFLLYDWNIEVGDVVYVRYGDSSRGLILDQITDTILGETERRVFHLHYEANPWLVETWIEGIGSELGFPFSGTKDNPSSMIVDAELLCYYEDGNQIWDNPNYDSCFINYLKVEENQYNDIMVYPNPTYGEVSIRLFETGEHNIEVYDIMGRKIMSTTVSGNNCTIDMNCLPIGLYNVVINNGKYNQIARIIKQ